MVAGGVPVVCFADAVLIGGDGEGRVIGAHFSGPLVVLDPGQEPEYIRGGAGVENLVEGSEGWFAVVRLPSMTAATVEFRHRLSPSVVADAVGVTADGVENTSELCRFLPPLVQLPGLGAATACVFDTRTEEVFDMPPREAFGFLVAGWEEYGLRATLVDQFVIVQGQRGGRRFVLWDPRSRRILREVEVNSMTCMEFTPDRPVWGGSSDTLYEFDDEWRVQWSARLSTDGVSSFVDWTRGSLIGCGSRGREASGQVLKIDREQRSVERLARFPEWTNDAVVCGDEVVAELWGDRWRHARAPIERKTYGLFPPRT